MTFYPDKPTRSTPKVLPALVDGEWLAQFKADGWRALVTWDGAKVAVTTRNGRVIKTGDGLAAELRRMMRATPAGTVLDGEWLGMRRTESNGDGEDDDRHWRRVREGETEQLVLFDVLRVGGTCTSNVGALARFRLLQEFWKATGGAKAHQHVRLVRSTCRRYREFFLAAAAEPLCEGIVLKRVGSRIIGAKDGCADNPQWLKVKRAAQSLPRR